MTDTYRGIRSAQIGLLVNAVLAATKLVAGMVGNSYALVADAIESTADIIGSLVVWSGLAVAAQPADANHPFGHGKAEAIAAAVVAFMLIGAALGIGYESLHGIRTPHEVPAPWTLIVLVVVVAVKTVMSRWVRHVGGSIGSTAVEADAWHHLSDAVTSGAAFVGIAIAVYGQRVFGGTGWAAADDWAALLASGIILFNGVTLLGPAMNDLMDRMPGDNIVGPVRAAAESVPGVLAVEKLWVLKTGLFYVATAHVQAAPDMPLAQAHELGHRVQDAIREAVPSVHLVTVHMEPYE
ncbi:MAG TPA: cation diffusion facilitator family transporter [Gemmatimonadaceae bacterium]|nr:cation diffusion facilitator family transporter [Gemmatimonadaceae bacterium]